MKKILISYDYFFPGFKAGGPIQSLVNLASLLNEEYNISVLTSANDLNETNAYENIKINNWNLILLPGTKNSINVWYADRKGLNYNTLKTLIAGLKPEIIYINSMYSVHFTLYPIIALKNLSHPAKVIICPRGMLQKGALQVKPLKKKVFLKGLKWSGIVNNVSWHATNEEEKKDIASQFLKFQQITIAPNVPKIPFDKANNTNKQKGKLNLVYLSLVSEKKNLHLLLKELLLSDNGVSLDIYGPIKDEQYWEQECKPLMNSLKERVIYKGNIEPINVQNKLIEYDTLVLLTKGENFGHALYESLSVGRPIITSYYTPWNNLEENKAGWNVVIEETGTIASLFNDLLQTDNNTFQEFCVGANTLAKEYYCLLYTSPSPRDRTRYRMPSSA